MTSEYDITVVVCTYNPVWKKLRATLKSIIEQEKVSLQIVITDDGSKDNLFREINNYFAELHFYEYKLIANEKNKGTVSNFYHGVVASDAKYIKGISPGDLLFEKTTLYKWLVFAKDTNADITFCDAVFYNFKGSTINLIKHIHNPCNVNIYKKPSAYHDRIITYVILGDMISGATILLKKELQLYYLNLLLNRVIFTEDFFLRLAVLDNRKIVYYPYIGIWYEYADGGISTTGDLAWKQRIQKDSVEMDNICLENLNEKDELVKKWFTEYLSFTQEPLQTRWLKFKRYVRHPKWLYFWIYGYLFRAYSPIGIDVTFLRECFYEN